MPLISRLGPTLFSRNLSEAMTKHVDAKPHEGEPYRMGQSRQAKLSLYITIPFLK